MRKTRIDFEIPLVFMKEGDAFVCFSPALDLYEHGTSYEDVYDAFKRKIAIFFHEIVKKGTLEKVLSECGWMEIKNKFTPPQIIGRSLESIHVTV